MGGYDDAEAFLLGTSDFGFSFSVSVIVVVALLVLQEEKSIGAVVDKVTLANGFGALLVLVVSLEDSVDSVVVVCWVLKLKPLVGAVDDELKMGLLVGWVDAKPPNGVGGVLVDAAVI